MKYPSILYWKWDDEHLSSKSYLNKIDDIAARSCFSHICITTHWCHNGIAHPCMHEHVKAACERIHKHNRRMIFEIDVRAEKKRFAERYPDSRMGFIYWQKQTAGTAPMSFSFPIVKGEGGELFFGDRQDGEALIAVYAFEKAADGTVDPSSIEALTDSAAIRRTDSQTVEVTVTAPAGLEVFAAVCSYYRFPDFWSDAYREMLEELMKSYRDIPLDGLSIDELGLLWYPDFDFTPGCYGMLDNAPVYGRSLARAFEAKYGMSYALSLLYRFCSSDQDPNKVKAINFYFDFIRAGISAAEEDFYQLTKQYCGKDAFVGVHSTWYAIEEVANTPEVWKNGITWWSAKRDYGFTDEIMLYPVRTALAHKENAPIFYNMWYGEATGDIDTYYTELYKNARFGGRTISLGYECTHEASVLDLYEKDYLEQVSAIESKLALLDALQTTAASCEVLVLMGLEACCNRLANQNGNGQWDSLRGVLKEAFTLTRDIFNLGYNTDLVGSCAVEDGSLSLDADGYVVYGSQKYKYMIAAYPEFCKPELLAFLKQVKSGRTGLCVVGKLHRDFYGRPAALPEGLVSFPTRPDAYDLIPLFQAYQAAKNRVENGCVLQDGAIIFTSPAPDRPTGNRFQSHFACNGQSYELEAEDLAYFQPGREGQDAVIRGTNARLKKKNEAK